LNKTSEDDIKFPFWEIKVQSLLYEDLILANDMPLMLKECYSFSKSLLEKGIYSWFSYVNHVRYENKINHSNEEFNKKRIKINLKENIKMQLNRNI
jgi:hypothetical protein